MKMKMDFIFKTKKTRAKWTFFLEMKTIHFCGF